MKKRVLLFSIIALMIVLLFPVTAYTSESPDEEGGFLDWIETAVDDIGSFFGNLFGGNNSGSETEEEELELNETDIEELITIPSEVETEIVTTQDSEIIEEEKTISETEPETLPDQEAFTTIEEIPTDNVENSVIEETIIETQPEPEQETEIETEPETEPQIPEIDRVLEKLGDNAYRETYQSLLTGETIQSGDYSTNAYYLQKLLVALGEPIEADGAAGTMTFQALNKVQYHCGVETTSYVDADVFETLLKCLLVYTDPDGGEEILGSSADYQMHVYDRYGGIYELSSGSSFYITFLDVGQADAAVIICDNEAMMIDGGDAADSEYIYSFLKKYNIDHLKYIFCSHPQEDHAGGLAAALNYATVDKAYCTSVTSDGDGFNNFVYYLNQQGIQLEIPESGMEFSLGSAAGKIVGPVNTNNSENDSSLVIKIKYGDTSILFTGDAEEREEKEIVNSGEDLSCTVLKVAHHGSDTSSSSAFLAAASPVYGIISCGAYNSYGHPADKTLERLKNEGVTLYRTDLQGTITMSSNGTSVAFTPEKNTRTDTYATYKSLYVEPETTVNNVVMQPGSDVNYIANLKTKKFHYPTCQSVSDMKEENKWYFSGTAEELVDLGYEPCGNCHPYAANYVAKTTQVETTAAVVAEAQVSSGKDYIVNTNTGKFHKPSCKSVGQMKESNKWYYHGTREELIAWGYSPCGNCNP